MLVDHHAETHSDSKFSGLAYFGCQHEQQYHFAGSKQYNIKWLLRIITKKGRFPPHFFEYFRAFGITGKESASSVKNRVGHDEGTDLLAARTVLA
jgi:hypothetical protein